MKTLEELKQEVLSEYDERVIALAQHLNIDLDPDFESYVDEEASEEEQQEQRDEAIFEVTNELDNIVEGHGNMFSYYNEDYYVLTDSEADDMEDQQLDNYIDECLEIPDDIRPYFDEEKWKRDARMDGRGHIISSYDGAEYEETVEGTTYYIYRV